METLPLNYSLSGVWLGASKKQAFANLQVI